MAMNKQIAQLGVTEQDYKDWCKEHKKAAYSSKNKMEFFAKVQDGRLVRDIKTGKLISKRRTKK